MSTEVSAQQAREVAEQAREQEWTLPSFGKELFLGNFRLDLIHPQPQLDPDAVEKGERFLRTLRAFLTDEVDALAIDADDKIREDTVRGLFEIGAMGMKVPEQYGGLGLSQVYYNRALAVAGVWHAAISTLMSAHQSIGVAQPLLLAGTEEQKQTWLPKVCREQVSAFLLTEPDAGSDPARMVASAVPTDDGSAYVLNGRKLWATNGAIAGVVVVMAKVPKSDGHRGGITCFILPTDTEGVTVEHRNRFMGLRGIENSQTLLSDVRVPAENIIGHEGQGLKIALSTLNTGRLAVPAVCAGVSKWATKIAREWGTERRQWGKPVGEHDAVAQKIATIAGTAFGLEATLDVASRLADNKKNDIRIEAALLKLYGSELGWRVVDDLMQVRGGRGYETAESLQARGERAIPVEAALRDMRINRIFEGSTEIMHLLIAREAVDQHLQVAGDLLEGGGDVKALASAAGRAGAFYAKWLPQLTVGKGQLPRSYDELGPLAPYMRYAERASRKLARSIFYGMTRWQAKLEYRQAFLGRLVDIGSELFAMAATAAYADTVGREHPERRVEALELAELFCAQAKRRADVLFWELWHNDDDANREAAAKLLDGGYRWLEEGIADPSGDGPM
ncbi:MAG TPA: acyl-CoA dehydrogenase family protein, partial [Solirubrobacteraceae bacterium]|nr:acyl-CoA dehydrogenase family protein [Solirubrobacteraceae bacterium]